VLVEILIDAISTGDKTMALRSRSSSEPTIDAIVRVHGAPAAARHQLERVHRPYAGSALWCVAKPTISRRLCSLRPISPTMRTPSPPLRPDSRKQYGGAAASLSNGSIGWRGGSNRGESELLLRLRARTELTVSQKDVR